VAINVFATLLIGSLCGALSVRLAGVLAPKPASRETASARRPPAATA